jgi:trimethylamine--corrinoid protein Co-methyltransferase
MEVHGHRVFFGSSWASPNTRDALTGEVHPTRVDDIVGMVRRFLRGVEVNADTLVREVIEKVGPGGNFLQEDHNVKYFRTEHWVPSLMDRQAREAWETTGAKTMGDRIRDKVRHILQTHKAPALSDAVLNELERLRRKGTKEIVK